MKEKAKPNVKEELVKFKLDHYENADFEHIEEKITSLFNKFKRLKNKNKQNRIVLDLYTLYLQAMETLFINAHAVSVPIESFPSALFISSRDLRQFIKDNFIRTTKFSRWFFTDLIFSIQTNKEDQQKPHRLYENLVKECAKDYLDNYELLNAYKHGFRINAKHGDSILSLETKDGKRVPLSKTDSTIEYFSMGREDGSLVIYRHKMSFQLKRIAGNVLFVSTLLDNIKTVILAGSRNKGKRVKLRTFKVADRQKWANSFGSFSFKNPIFSLKKLKEVKQETAKSNQ